MFQANTDIPHTLGEFRLENCMFRYSEFVPKIYNYCKSLGCNMSKVMPSRAFCSDENQGYPIILITKHFGTFPFNHGRVGGVMGLERHAPHAAHGQDVLIIQASHVGYQPDEKSFGEYRRVCTEHDDMSKSCGKLADVISWYQAEYNFAKNAVFLQRMDNENYIVVDNQLIDENGQEGLFINLDALAASSADGRFIPHTSYSTSKCFLASSLLRWMFRDVDGKRPIGNDLQPEHFHYRRRLQPLTGGTNPIEHNLFPVMPWIVSSPSPLLTAAKVNVQVEFDRAFRTIVKEAAYHGKRVVYIAGLNIDISPDEHRVFPVTEFVPWAMFVQHIDGSHDIFEQAQLVDLLKQLSNQNPDQIELDEAIRMMEDTELFDMAEPR